MFFMTINMSSLKLIVTMLAIVFVSNAEQLYKCCPNNQLINKHGYCESISASNSSSGTTNTFLKEAIYIQGQGPTCGYWDALILDWNSTNKFSITENGSLELNSRSSTGRTEHTWFNQTEFCTDINSQHKQVIKLCPCERLVCLRKCCPFGYVYNLSRGERCIKPYESSWQPALNVSFDDTHQIVNYEVLEDRLPKCNGFHNYASTAYIPSQLLNNFWWTYPTGKAFQGRQLCKDMIEGNEFEMSIICEEVVAWDRILKPVWHIPATVLLVATLVTLAVLPDLRVGTHGKALFSHALALLVLNAALAINTKHTFFWIQHETYVFLRKTTDIIVHYTVWVSAFWLNAICINIALGFKTNTTVKNKDKESRKFILFCLYAWGCPAIITSIFISLRFLPNSVVPFMWKPTLIETRSGHYELEGLLKLTSFLYFFAPMLLLLIINLSLFGFTSKKVWSLRRESKLLTMVQDVTKEKQMTARNLQENMKSVLLYARLLWLMGILEMTMELVAWATSHYFCYEVIMDGVDLLRAACIFWLTCCKRRVAESLRARLRRGVLRARSIKGLAQKRQSYEMGSMGTTSTSTRG